jgi:multidrug efflux pump subunit AcrA (membrane-fusion protein)
MKRSAPLILVLVLGAAGAGWWWTQRAAPAAAPPAAGGNNSTSRSNAPQTVTVAAVQQRDVPVTLETAGTVVALNSVDVRAQVSTTVRSVAVQEGQFVRRGEPLFSFDDRGDRAVADRSRAQLVRDRALLAELQRQLDRAKDLRGQGFVSQSNVDAVQSQYDAQLAAIRADEATVQASEVTLSYGNISAPMAGRAGSVNVTPGSLVTPGGSALVTISQIDPIGVAFNVPEAQLANLMRSQQAAGVAKGAGKAGSAAGGKAQGKAEGRLAGASGAAARPSGAGSGAAAGGATSGSDGRTGAAALAAGAIAVSLPVPERGRNAPPPEAWPGRISFIDNAVDTSTGTIRVKGSLANAQQQLWPGQYVTVRMTLRTIKDALVVPVAAIIQRGNERSVYLVTADGKAEQKVVQQRYVFGDSVVVEGLSTNDRVVVEGKQNLRTGTPVREAAAAGSAASGASAASAASAGARP